VSARSFVRSVLQGHDAAAARHRAIFSVFLLSGSWAIVGGLFQPLLPLYVASIGGSATDVGLASSSHALAMLFSEPLWGLMGDRSGAAMPLLVSRLVTGTVFVAFLLRTDVWWVFVLQFVRGLFDVALAPIGRALLATLLPRQKRGTAMAMWYTTNQFGRSGMGFVGGGIVDTLGFRVLFVICAALTMGSAILGFLGLRRLPGVHPERPVSLDEPEGPSLPAPRARTRRELMRPFLIISGVTALGTCAQSGWRTFVPLYAAVALGLSASEIGWLFTISGLAVLAFTVPGGQLADRFGRRPLLLAGLGLSLIPTLAIAIGLAASFAALLALMVVGSMGNAAFNPARTALLSDLAPAGRHGTVIGIYGMAEDVGLLIGPLAGGLLWDRYGPAAAFSAFALVSLIALGTAFTLIRESED